VGFSRVFGAGVVRVVIGWLIFGGYIVGFVMTCRRSAWIVAHELKIGDRLAGDDIVVGIIVGICAGACWPIVVLGYILHHAKWGGNPLWLLFLKEPRSVRRAEELKRREDAVAGLERLKHDYAAGHIDFDTFQRRLSGELEREAVAA
jgi:hypothetical protein